MKTTYRILSRNSPLALRQSDLVLQALKPYLDNLTLSGTTTPGDTASQKAVFCTHRRHKGQFVRHLEQMLLNHEADMAVHSMKDMTVDLPDGLMIAAILPRTEPRDVLITHTHTPLNTWEPHQILGTNSPRRRAYLQALYPKLTIKPVQGNINTRLQYLEQGHVHGLVLAAAGMLRMGWETRIHSYFDPQKWVPAPGQGALGVQCRTSDHEIIQALQHINHQATHTCITAERAVVRALGAHCFIPLGAYATINPNQRLTLQAILSNLEGTHRISSCGESDALSPNALGLAVAEDLIHQGAQTMIQECLNAQ